MKYKAIVRLKKLKGIVKLKKEKYKTKMKKTKAQLKIPKEVVAKTYYIESGEEDFTGKVLGFPLEGKYNGTLI